MNPFFSFDDDEFFGDLLLMGAAAGGGSVVQETATGNPVTFLTDLAKPLKSLLVPFLPVQSGSGDPSPQNIRPIVAWDGVKVWNGGKNLFDASAVIRRDRFLLNDNGVEQSTSSSGYTLNRTKVKPGAVYTISGTIVKGSESCRLYFYNGDTFVSRTSGINVGSIPYTFTVPQDCDGIAIQYNMGTVDFSTIQLSAGQTATAYEPYAPITETDISFLSHVYGGTLDVVSGVLTVEYTGWVGKWSEMGDEADLGDVTRKRIIIDETFANIGSGSGKFCNMAKYKSSYGDNSVHFYVGNGGRMYLFLPNETDGDTEVQIVSILETPKEIQLTPEQITAIKGNNTIWSDANGDLTAVYLKKG